MCIRDRIGHLTEDAMDERPMLTETFVDNAEELLTRVVEQIRDEVEQDIHILPSLKNKEIIKPVSYTHLLHHPGLRLV